MATHLFQLVMRAGPKPGQVYELSTAEITIGRDIGNEIVVSDAEVSRKHARLYVQAGQYVLEDLGSTNGTFINDQRISGPKDLSAGDTIQFGEHVVFDFEEKPIDPDATVAVSSKDLKAEEPVPDSKAMAEPESPPKTPPGPEPAAIPAAPPQPQYQPPPADTFQEPAFSPPPVEEIPLEEEPAQNNRRTIFLVGCGCLTLLVLCVVVPFVASFFVDFQSLLGF